MGNEFKEIIAIDGPAGSGKSTVARLLADKLETLYLDTGAMYRAITLKALSAKVDLDDTKKLADLTKKTDLLLKTENKEIKVILDGKDVTSKLRTSQINQNISKIAKDKNIRKFLVKLQRKLASGGGVIEGRDISTVVFPDAFKKFYLDAHLDERINRRFNQVKKESKKTEKSLIKEEVINRDKSDRTRKIGPLRIAPDAAYIDTTKMTIEEVVDKLFKLIKQKN